jgi:hypothetical protein
MRTGSAYRLLARQTYLVGADRQVLVLDQLAQPFGVEIRER